ncbi:MAG: hypothetical protein GY797_23195 [Deltaproteobacteria bacterium]|jgi:hypothetical protein|nr:hypothetical protein [Deltaproteobacteria bacterium]
MTNVGYVLYKKGDEPGTLIAKWCHSDYGNGTGIATGGPAEGFEGRYHIRYFDEKGNIQADRELDIQKDGDYYQLSWINNGEISGRGIGMENAEGLSVGYRDIEVKQPQPSET